MRLERKVVCRDFPRDYVWSIRYCFSFIVSVFPFFGDCVDLPRARARARRDPTSCVKHSLVNDQRKIKGPDDKGLRRCRHSRSHRSRRICFLLAAIGIFQRNKALSLVLRNDTSAVRETLASDDSATQRQRRTPRSWSHVVSLLYQATIECRIIM